MSSPSQLDSGGSHVPGSGLDQFGRYEVLDSITGPGPRRIFRALDPLTRRAVALKAIRPQPGHAERRASDRQALRYEAQAVGRLSHSSVVQIYDYGEDFFVMEFARGESLAARLRTGPLPELQPAIGVLKALADALDHAHGRGVVHGDLQPANVIVPQDGPPKLVGFGRARILDEDVPAGTLGAHPAYAAPERLLQEPWGGAAEVFSLGVIAYEMLTARRPFEGEEPGLVTFGTLYEDPTPPTRFCPSLPAVYDDVFAWALAKDPEHRPPTAAAFVQALESACPRGARVAPRAPRRPVDDETFDLAMLLQEEAASPRPPERPHVAEDALEVATDPAGAGVFLDGMHVGETPLVLRDLGHGPHTLRLIRRGHTSVQSVLEAGRGRTRLMFTLQPLPRRRRARRPGAITLAETLRGTSSSWMSPSRES